MCIQPKCRNMAVSHPGCRTPRAGTRANLRNDDAPASTSKASRSESRWRCSISRCRPIQRRGWRPRGDPRGSPPLGRSGSRGRTTPEAPVGVLAVVADHSLHLLAANASGVRGRIQVRANARAHKPAMPMETTGQAIDGGVLHAEGKIIAGVSPEDGVRAMSDPWGRLCCVREIATSSRAAARLERAREWLCARARGEHVLVVAATQDGAAEMVRDATRLAGAAFGWQRFTLGRLAAVIAAETLAARGLSPLSALGVEAVCARVVQRMRGRLGRFEPIAGQPGLPRALSRSLQELRLAGARPGGSLGALLAAYEAELDEARLADRAGVFRLALEAESPLFALPALLVDLPLRAALEERLVGRLCAEVLAVAARRRRAHLAGARRGRGGARGAAGQLARARAAAALRRRRRGASAARRRRAAALGAWREAASAWRSRGCSCARRSAACPSTAWRCCCARPRSTGRCSRRRLRARECRRTSPPGRCGRTRRDAPSSRFWAAPRTASPRAVSPSTSRLGEVPQAVGGAPPEAPPAGERWVPPDTELTRLPAEEPVAPAFAPSPDPDAPVVDGSLRAPWRWEKLLSDAAVIWRARSAGNAGSIGCGRSCGRTGLRSRTTRPARSAPTATSRIWLHCASSPCRCSGRWPRCLPRPGGESGSIASPPSPPARCARPSACFRCSPSLLPWPPVGPVPLDEVRLVLAPAPHRAAGAAFGERHGKVFVAPVESARGLSFDVVFVAGAGGEALPAEGGRGPAAARSPRGDFPELETSQDRIAAERLALAPRGRGCAAQLVLS